MVKVTRLPTGIRWQGQRPGFPEQVPLKFTGKLLQWGFFLFFFSGMLSFFPRRKL